jgi:DNA-directed RNA polymerase subunit E'/Rpb7
MKDDFYEWDEKNYRVIGRRRKKIYRLGDEVEVRVKKTDIDRRLMDLMFETTGPDLEKDERREDRKFRHGRRR